MDTRLLILAIPSAVILAGLIWHSFQAMPRWRATAFWVSVVAYGFVRGVGVRRVTESIGASFPYEIHNPTLSIFGVSAQEVVGWAVVAYLGWWIGARFSRHLFMQMAWASLFLGAISWAVEAAAIAARWWHWTVPTASRVFLNVPAIGIVDWFFVGIDFLLPFAAITSAGEGRPSSALRAPSPASGRRHIRYLTLLFFPLHFGAHLLPGVWLHVVHWCLVLIVLWLAIRSDVEDRPFADRLSWIPSAGFAVIVVDVAAVELLVVKRPELLPSIVPAVTIWLAAIRPQLAAAVAGISLLIAWELPSMLVATVVAIGGAALLWSRRRRMAVAAVVLIAAFAFFFHHRTAADRADMARRLDLAMAERNRGNLPGATAALEAIARDHPTSYVALALGGEIDYRTNHLDDAHTKFARAVAIKQDFVRGYRFLAVIDLQRGRRAEATRWASLGLEVAPDDLQLRYLAGQPVLDEIDSAETARGMAALAFEVGDHVTAKRLLEKLKIEN